MMLARFSEVLVRRPDEVTQEAATARDIFEHLKKKFNVDSYLVTSQLGSARDSSSPNSIPTQTIYPSFELVIFSTKTDPPYQAVLQDWADHLSASPKYEIVNALHSQFMGILANKSRVDIFPAKEFQGRPDQLHRHISLSPNPIQEARLYSASFAGHAHRYILDQPPFVQSVLRLTRHWIHGVLFEESHCIRRRCYLVDCVTVEACKSVPTGNLEAAFTEFLRLLTHFQKLRIYFHHPLEPFLNYRGPVVLDPVNPHDNLALFRTDPKIQEDIQGILQTAAMSTWWRYSLNKDKFQTESELASVFLQNGPSARSRRPLGKSFLLIILGLLVYFILIAMKLATVITKKVGLPTLIGAAIVVGILALLIWPAPGEDVAPI